MKPKTFAVLSEIIILCFVLTGTVQAECPSADLTGDCFVDLADIAFVANQWLTGDPNIPDDMAYIPAGGFEMGDIFLEGHADELPLHAVLLDAFFIGRFEITNQQYCDFLNAAYPGQLKIVDGIVYAASDSANSYPYCDTYNYAPYYSLIDFNDPDFSVRTEDGRDMSNDPMVGVSWYGAVAYCNWRSIAEGYESCYDSSTWECDFVKHGYRLPTEAEWEYTARGGLPGKRFPWGDTISHAQANYFSFWTAGPYLPYDESTTPGHHPGWASTSVVGSFLPNGFGLYDMAGNVCEWCNDWYDEGYYAVGSYDNPTGPVAGTSRIVRGGSHINDARWCRVADRERHGPATRYGNFYFGFRVVLDLE